MLFWFRTFLDCKEVKSVISIGCCYNLLSEEDYHVDSQFGFPMSIGVKSTRFSPGKCLLDLACQVNLYLVLFLSFTLQFFVICLYFWVGKGFTFLCLLWNNTIDICEQDL